MESNTSKKIDNNKGSVKFPCPKCQKGIIVRSVEDRKLCLTYTCPECGFVGPN